MSFAETYSAEVLQSRQVRSQRAFFWARVVGFALMLTVAFTLRAEPQLRALLLRGGMDAISSVMKLNGGAQPPVTVATRAEPDGAALPKPRIKINRPGDGVALSAQDNPDMNAIAAEIARVMAAQRVGN